MLMKLNLLKGLKQLTLQERYGEDGKAGMCLRTYQNANMFNLTYRR